MKIRIDLKSSALALATAFAGIANGEVAWGATQILSVDYRSENGKSLIDVSADGPITFVKKQGSKGDRQLVLELSDVTLAKSAQRPLDTSAFEGPIQRVAASMVKGEKDQAKIVVQLKAPAKSSVIAEGNRLSIQVANEPEAVDPNSGSLPADIPPPPPSDGALDAVGSVGVPPADPSVGAPSSPSAPPAAPPAESPPVAEAPKDPMREKTNIDVFAESQQTKKFVGKPITLQVRDAELSEVVRMVGESAGFNILVGDEVKGKITLSLVEVPWDQALDVILRTRQLGAERSNNILRVVSLASLTQEKQAELQAKIAQEASAPRVTKIFPISYAKLPDLKTMLEKFSGSNSVGSGGGSSAGSSGGSTAASGANATMIQADERTNALIVRDTTENVDKMRKLIEILDTQTPQVLIEAKIVEATESFSKSLGGSLGVGSPDTTATTQFFGSFSGLNPINPLFGSPGVFSDGAAAAQLSSGGGGMGFSILPGAFRINALLNMGESEQTIKVVSSPKTVVLNRESASIVAGTPVIIKTQQVIQGLGTVPVESIQSANLSLNVKPTVTNEGSVLMDIQVQRDQPFGAGIANRSLNTRVMVDSGNTLVIGGIYTNRSARGGSGMPFLRKIPILGALFGSESDSNDRSELFIFVTPRILNEKEAGLTG